MFIVCINNHVLQLVRITLKAI